MGAPVHLSFPRAASLARELIAAASEDSAAIANEERERARTEGFAEGIAEGMACVMSQVSDFNDLSNSLLSRLKDQLIEVTPRLFHELLGEALRIQPESIRARISRAIAPIPRDCSVKLTIHPSLKELVICTDSRITLQSDPEIPVHGIRLSGVFGELYAEPGEHLSRILARLPLSELATCEHDVP